MNDKSGLSDVMKELMNRFEQTDIQVVMHKMIFLDTPVLESGEMEKIEGLRQIRTNSRSGLSCV